jgi:hypothetical protein
MKSLVDLLEYLLLDCGGKCDVQPARDIKTLRRRVEHEGESFITLTLPKFCRDFERSLAEERIAPAAFQSFKKTGGGRIPAFLQGFLSKVFNRDGTLLLGPSTDCIRAVRQLCLFGKKVLRPCSEERVQGAIDEFRKCDDDVASALSGPYARYFRLVAAVVCRSLELDDVDMISTIEPSHGPGATQESISGNQKWIFRRWHKRLHERGFTYLRFGCGSQQAALDDPDTWPGIVEPEDEAPVRVVLVPKTLSTPRVIAVEPVCMQFAQQGLSRVLVRALERDLLTQGHVNFRDQGVNQGLALSASKDGNLATLDMKEASDRVSMAHAEAMFESCPRFWDWLQACRSMRAKLPTGDVITLKKFASMGSALCFPVEALVFYTSIIAIRLYRAGKVPTRQTVLSQSRSVFVYGDDLIVPADEASAICDGLESLGFQVNRPKSFWTGKFRESCGWDCYDGEQVTPVYLRRDVPTSRSDASGIVSCVSTANQLYKAGYRQTAMALRWAVEALIGPLPLVRECESSQSLKTWERSCLQPHGTPALGWWQHSDLPSRRRWNRLLQRGESYCWVPVSPKDPDPLSGDAALAKCWRTIGKGSAFEPFPIDPLHLERSIRPYSLTLKRRWVPHPA